MHLCKLPKSSATTAMPLTLAGRPLQPHNSQCDAPSGFVQAVEKERQQQRQRGPRRDLREGHNSPFRPAQNVGTNVVSIFRKSHFIL